MKNQVEIKIKDGEVWYSGIIDDTINMPYTQKTECRVNPFTDILVNQINPSLVSSLGRYLYAKDYFAYEIKNGVITVCSDGEIESGEKKDYLSALNYLKDKYFPACGKTPLKSLFKSPQYCTWMALGYNQTQDGVVGFAKSIVEAGMPSGALIIDDGWSWYYGDWDFNKYRFPNPKKMCDELNALGFTVAVWICPYVSPDSSSFRELDSKGLLLTKNGQPLLAKWWNGYSACIDFTNPDGVKWFTDKIDFLVNEYGINGVKMDGGDAYIYGNGVDGFLGKNLNGVTLSNAYARVSARYQVSELRGAAGCANLPVMERIADRTHDWEDKNGGFDGIVKKCLVMSAFGYPFNAPDMVGGGLIGDKDGKEDEELNIRYMQAATLMPAMQFSKTLWTYSAEMKKCVLDMLALRKKYAPLLLSELEKSGNTGEPALKTLFYKHGVQPENLEQFFIGDDLIVAPVLKKGQREQSVYLPDGEWMYPPTGERFTGGKTVTVSAPLEVLPYFEKGV